MGRCCRREWKRGVYMYMSGGPTRAMALSIFVSHGGVKAGDTNKGTRSLYPKHHRTALVRNALIISNTEFTPNRQQPQAQHGAVTHKT